MQLSVERKLFAQAVGFAKRGAERTTAAPLLACGLLRATKTSAVLRTTNLDRQIDVSFAVKSSGRLATCLPIHVLDDVIRKANKSDTVALSDDGLKIALKFGTLRIGMSPLDVADFPEMEARPMTHRFEMDAHELLRALSRTQFAISTEEARYYLGGVFLHFVASGSLDKAGQLHFVATDGTRLAKVETVAPRGAADMPGIIIPGLTVADMVASLRLKGASDTVALGVGPTRFEFEHGNVSIRSKVIDGTYPDYGRVIPLGNDKVLVVDRIELVDTLKAVSGVRSRRDNAIKLAIAHGTLTASVTNAELGHAAQTIAVDYDSAPIDVGVNAADTLAFLERLTSERVRMLLADPGSPILVSGQEPADTGVLFVQMPMRV